MNPFAPLDVLERWLRHLPWDGPVFVSSAVPADGGEAGPVAVRLVPRPGHPGSGGRAA